MKGNTTIVGESWNLPVFPDATDAFSNVSTVNYSTKRYMYNQHFWEIA